MLGLQESFHWKKQVIIMLNFQPSTKHQHRQRGLGTGRSWWLGGWCSRAGRRARGLSCVPCLSMSSSWLLHSHILPDTLVMNKQSSLECHESQQIIQRVQGLPRALNSQSCISSSQESGLVNACEVRTLTLLRSFTQSMKRENASCSTHPTLWNV